MKKILFILLFVFISSFSFCQKTLLYRNNLTHTELNYNINNRDTIYTIQAIVAKPFTGQLETFVGYQASGLKNVKHFLNKINEFIILNKDNNYAIIKINNIKIEKLRGPFGIKVICFNSIGMYNNEYNKINSKDMSNSFNTNQESIESMLNVLNTKF